MTHGERLIYVSFIEGGIALYIATMLVALIVRLLR